MPTPLYFPTVAKANSGGAESVLCSLTLKRGEKPGLFPQDLPEKTDDRFWQPLLRVAKRLPIELNARGFNISELRFSGPSATGCVSFFEKYDVDAMEDGGDPPQIAISVRSAYDDDGVDKAKRVSDMEAKVKLCLRYEMDLFVLSKENKPDLEGMTIVKEEYETLDLDTVRKEDLQRRIREKKLLILLAARDWEKKLADLLGLRERDDSERSMLSATDEITTQQPRLYDLFLAALAGDEEEQRMLHKIFHGGGKSLGDAGMSRDTFPWKVMHEQDEEGKPYRDIVFGDSSLVLSGSTSTGKTTLAKALMLHALAQGKQTVYIAPTRALVYEVYQDFCELLESLRARAADLDEDEGKGEYRQLIEDLVTADDSRFVLSTGEKNEKDGQVLRGDYLILFSVYEKANLFMNMLSLQAEGRRPDIIIIDELHMLCDEDRGGILDLFMGKVLSMRWQDEVRLIGITTEDKGADTVKNFLRSLGKPVSLLSIPHRPLPVDHYLLAGEKTSLIASLRGTVDGISQREQRRIARELYTEENVRFDPLVMLNSRHPEKHTPHKKVIAVFDSIAAIYRAVESLSSCRLKNADGEVFCTPGTVERLKEALETSFINGDEKKILLKGIQAGIFVYYSPLDYTLREEMARAFQKDCDKTQILLTTEALAYGVNFPADAIYLTYFRESDPVAGAREGNFIKRNLFFNILGRAGRLGKSTHESACCAFIALSGSGIPLQNDIRYVLNLYGEDSAFRVKTLDRDAEDGILARDTVRSLDDVSFITFRSALDALRFVASNMEGKRTTVREVRDFLERSMYGWQFCAGEDLRKRRENLETLLSALYGFVFDACLFQKNRLVESSSYHEDTLYSCTDLASALIDTGTSWKAIEPMSQWLQDIAGFEKPLPVELLLVGMLPVEELWSSIRSFDMLSRDINVSPTSIESNERAREWLRQEVKKTLPQGADGESDVDRILKAISDYVEHSCADLILSPRHRQMPDHATRLNSFSRLLAALFAWARGASSDEIQKFAFPKDKRDLANSFSPRYGERVCWLCLLCLRFFSKTREIRLCPEHEGALQNLAMRMRYGVPSDCIPLMGTGKSQQNRTAVLMFRERFGTNLQTVMQHSVDSYIRIRGDLEKLSERKYAVIQKNAVEHYCRAAVDLCALLMRGNFSETTKSSFEQLQAFFQSYKPSWDDAYDGLEGIKHVKDALCGIPREDLFSSRWIGDELIIRSKRKGSSAWELVIVLLDPSDTLVKAQCSLQRQKDAAKDREAYEEAMSCQSRLKEIGDVKSVRERIKNMNSARELIYVWLPWNTLHDIPAPQLPALNLMSLALLLRQLEETGLTAVCKWIQRQKANGPSHLRIQQLIAGSLDSEAPEAIEGLRTSLSGDILQGVLQMEDPVFPYMNC